MLCANCFTANYEEAFQSKQAVIHDRLQVIENLACGACPACGDITFTHPQCLAADEKRIFIEHGAISAFTPRQLGQLRKLLNLTPEELSEHLSVAGNSFGMWERGEAAVSPSVNLIIRRFIESVPEARVNLIEEEMLAALEKARKSHFSESISLGEFLRRVVKSARIDRSIICDLLGIGGNELERIENNDLHPENLPVEVSAAIVRVFGITMKDFRQLLENTLETQQLRGLPSLVAARTRRQSGREAFDYSRSMSRIMEQYVGGERSGPASPVNPEYLEKVEDCLLRKDAADSPGKSD